MHNAKQFKEEFTRRNVKLSNGCLNLQSMRLGINSIMALSSCIASKPVSIAQVKYCPFSLT